MKEREREIETERTLIFRLPVQVEIAESWDFGLRLKSDILRSRVEGAGNGIPEARFKF